MSLSLPEPLAIERAGLKAWPGIEVEWDGAWVRRSANGYTKRANSVQCFDPADDQDVVRRIDDACRWFAARGLPPVFRVNQLSGPNLAAALAGEGWRADSPTRVLAMPLDEVRADPRGEVLPLTDPTFLEAQRQLKQLDPATLSKLRALLAVMAVPACGLVVRDRDGRPVSTALMAIADGIVVAGSVETDAAARRRGYGKAVMQTGLAWARAQGAAAAALNVEADNAAALALYQGLGYRPHYEYIYRIARTS